MPPPPVEGPDAPRPAGEPPVLVADYREPVAVLEGLADLGVPFRVESLSPGDFVVGSCAVERKTPRDLYASLIRKRLFEQLERLQSMYERPHLLLEGDLGELESVQSPGVVWGAIAAVTRDLAIPVVPTRGPLETAQFLAALHRRELAEGRGTQVRFKPPREFLPLREQQKFAVQGLPRVGDRLSEALLNRFGSVRNVFLAREKDLLRVPLVGAKTAREIEAFLDAPFASPQARIPLLDEGEPPHGAPHEGAEAGRA